ncbi:uncharacterized protein JCM15063_004120 [Sporobolomyces koalae]|uniref:uncharacterized protein n=1 Tax=Sporobolomyces koalae TaxID=500713 RepID=UPI00318098A5
MSFPSPRLNYAGLRLPPRSDSSPAISPTSTTAHVFPPSGHSPYEPPTPSQPFGPPSSTTARFHSALAAYPAANRHASTTSVSSIASNGFDPLDSTSPLGERAFDAMQRELGGAPGQQGLGFVEPVTVSQELDRSREAPELGDSSSRSRIEVSSGRESEADGVASRRGRFGIAAKQPSVDLDNSMAFLLSPPPLHDISATSNKHFAAVAVDNQKSIPRNGRVFPAPLLLKGGAPSPSSPQLGHTPPLSIPRRPSAGSGSLASPSTSYNAGRGWGTTTRSESQREGIMGPPTTTTSRGDEHQSNLPYQRHRAQQSSTSSLSQGSYLPYNTGSYTNTNSNSSTGFRHHAKTSSSTVSPFAAPGLANSQSQSSNSTVPLNSYTSPPMPPTTAQASAPASNSLTSDPPISSQALLLHIHSLRSAASPMALSQSQGPLPRSPAPLIGLQQHQRIRSAGSSTEPDPSAPKFAEDRSARSGALTRLDTVDLSHKRIAEVPVEVVEALKDEVEKLALGYNLLKDLPPHFAGFGNHLKYLNVRVNLLTTFPQVLCEMPSIEILDISRNKIRKLPQNPGTLVNLKVFSIAKNRVKRLPSWFTSMSHLKVLKLDHNPLEWPPREITTFRTTGSVSGAPMSKQEEADEMQRWLPALIRWMRDNKDKEVERERERDQERRRKPSNPPDLISEDDRVHKAASQQVAGFGRSESGRIRNSPSLPSIESFSRPPLRPTLTDYPLSPPGAPAFANAIETFESDPSARHSRNASHSLMQSLDSAFKSGLKTKKSLPDLRQSHADILAERRSGATTADAVVAPTLPSIDSKPLRLLRAQASNIARTSSADPTLETQHSAPAYRLNETGSTAPTPAGAGVRSESSRSTPRHVPAASIPNTVPKFAAEQPSLLPPTKLGSGNVSQQSAPTHDFDRNSGAYFRRQSMLPASTIAKTVPATLLQFVEAIRGILFSLSQIYSALRQFIVFASQGRLPATIARSLGLADQTTNALINALDRFDAQARRGVPPQQVVKQVFLSCRESVAVFGQLVGVLQPQLKTLTDGTDIRFTRTLLLMLYGSMGEIANSWSSVLPLFPALDQDPSSASTMVVLQPPTPSPTLERSVSMASSGSNGAGPRLTRARSVTRRHAGSFSVEDVQLGAVLPPAEIPPVPLIPPSASLDDVNAFDTSTGAATIRARPSISSTPKSSSASGISLRAPPSGGLSLPPPMRYQDMIQSAFEQPLTPGGTGLFEVGPPPSTLSEIPPRSNSTRPALLAQSSSASVSSVFVAPSQASIKPLASAVPASYNPHRESRQVSTLNADETFVDQADSTIQIAFDVYGMLLDSFDDPNAPTSVGAIGRRRARELAELCKAGNETTGRLQRGVERVRGGDGRGRLKFTSSDARRLGDASFDFVQTVIKFARAVKATSAEVSFAPQVREGVGQLTLATREFAKLLSQNQTSFRPSEQTGPSPSAAVNNPREGPSIGPSGGASEVKTRDYGMM